MIVLSQVMTVGRDIASQGSSNSTVQKNHFQLVQYGLVQDCAVDLCPICKGQVQAGGDICCIHHDKVPMRVAVKDCRSVPIRHG